MSKMKKKFGAEITGVIDLNNDCIRLEVEDVAESVNLKDFISEFNGKLVKICVSFVDEV